MISLRTPSGDRDIGAVSIRTPGGDKDIARISMLTANGDKDLFSSTGASGFEVTTDRTVVYGAASDGGTVAVTTSNVFATAENGTPPYTYLWSQLTGDINWSINNSDNSFTSFRHSQVLNGTSEQATFRVTVLDDRGRSATADVAAIVYNYGGPFA